MSTETETRALLRHVVKISSVDPDAKWVAEFEFERVEDSDEIWIGNAAPDAQDGIAGSLNIDLLLTALAKLAPDEFRAVAARLG